MTVSEKQNNSLHFSRRRRLRRSISPSGPPCRSSPRPHKRRRTPPPSVGTAPPKKNSSGFCHSTTSRVQDVKREDTKDRDNNQPQTSASLTPNHSPQQQRFEKEITQQATNVTKLKFSPHQGILFYKPGTEEDGNDATMKVNGKNVPRKIMPRIHPVTTSKNDGTTPRHMATEHLMEMIQPMEVNPLQGEVIQILGGEDGGKVVATILYATAQSKDTVLRNLFSTYMSKRQRIHKAIHKIPKSKWHVDDLGGGMYCPMGFGSIPPSNNEKKLGNLRLHRTRHEVRKITTRKNLSRTTIKTRST